MLCFRAKDYNKVALGSTWVFVTAVADQLLRNFLSDIQQLVAEHLAVFDGTKKRYLLGNLVTAKMFWARQQRTTTIAIFQTKTHARGTVKSPTQSRNASDSILIVGEKVDRPPAISNFLALSIAAWPHKKQKI